MKTVLAAVDFSEGSFAALQFADEMARVYDSDVTVLHVVPRSTQVQDSGIDPKAAELLMDGLLNEGKLVTNLQEQLELFLARAPDPRRPRRVIFRAGTPAATIVKTATALDAVMIVMSTHGRRGLERLVLGSVTGEVVKLARLPVLTLRPDVVPGKKGGR